jgi:hypothetical protein
MADVQVKTGGYTILAKTTQEFFFWWGDNALPAAYFDVSIEPNPKIFDMKPLTEERRKVTLFSGSPRQSMLILTLKNDNDFDVEPHSRQCVKSLENSLSGSSDPG